LQRHVEHKASFLRSVTRNSLSPCTNGNAISNPEMIAADRSVDFPHGRRGIGPVIFERNLSVVRIAGGAEQRQVNPRETSSGGFSSGTVAVDAVNAVVSLHKRPLTSESLTRTRRPKGRFGRKLLDAGNKRSSLSENRKAQRPAVERHSASLVHPRCFPSR